MILFCFISLLGTASAEEIINDNIASNDASIDIDNIESPVHEDISISAVENSDVSADDSSTVNGSASKGKLTANKLSADHTFTGSTFDELQSFLNSGNINDGDTVYLGNKTITSSWSQWDNPEKFIDINIPNLVLCGGTSSNPDSFSTLSASAGLFNIVASGVTFSNLILLNGQVNNDNPAPIKMQGANTKFENCVFENNGGRSGGAIYGTSAATGTTFNNCNFTRNGYNWNGYGGGAFYLEGSDTIVTNCNFDHNNGAGSIGAFHAGSNTLIENCSFRDNSAQSYGAVHLVGDNVTITNCNFTNNQGSNGPGGAIYYDGNGLKVTDSNFDSNKGNAASAIHSTGAINVTNTNFTSNGPGVIYSGGDTQIIDCNFVGTTGTSVSVISRGSTKSENNNFTNNGGSSIYSDGITEINNTNFVNNGAGSYNNRNVGAVYSADATTVSNSKFENNKANNNGYGGIYSMGETNVTNCNFTQNTMGSIYSGADTKITDCNFDSATTGNSVNVVSNGATTVENSNFTNNPGGVIYSASNTEISNSNFIDNAGGSYNNTGVGAVYSGGTTTVSNSKFERNNVSNNAYGGITSQGAATVSDSNFTENGGGAIHSYADAQITNCIIENHSSLNSAVNIYGTAIVSNSNFTDNSNNGWGSGGALYSTGDNSQITDCNFENNKAPNAGAIYLSGESTKVENCNFTNNNATGAYGQAGAIDVVGENIQVINSNFKENSAPSGGAIHIGARGFTVSDSTFEKNSATHGGAINIYHDDATITNCNFTDNDASEQGGAVYIGADCYNADMTECNFTGNTAGTGTAIYAADGANGKVTDCEFGVKPELNVNNGYPVLTLTLETDYSGIIVGDIEGGPSGGSTVPEANETIVLEIFDSQGTLVATVTNKTDEKGQIKYDYSHLPRGNYTYKATYMDGQVKEGPLNMGVVEGDNFSAIQAAIDAAEPGSVIFLENKTYYNDIQGTMAINKPITIIGTDGTVLDAEGLSRIFTIADNIDNVNLNNITFINGNVVNDDGGAIYVGYGSDNLNLVNCNFTNNHATGDDSQGGALFISTGANNGNIINSTFDNNTADVDGGAIRNGAGTEGAWGWNIYNTSFTNNSAVIDVDSKEIHWGGGAIWTCNAPMNLYNCNFTDNSGTYGGAIRGAVSTYECLFDNNTAINGNGGAIDVTTDEGLYDRIDLEFVNTTFINNDAKGNRGDDRAQGGGIHIYHLKEIEMYGCYCENNTADRGGAIDFYELERTFVENCTIINNNASSEGGGMAIFCNRSIFTDTNVSNNNAGTDGGAIWVIGHNALFDNITSINNTAERGGSSFINGTDTVIVNCNITNNTAVYNPSKPDDSGLGGAIDVIGDNCRIINLTSEDNNAYRGGSTFICGNNTVVYNSTFDNNNADLRGGGLNIAGNGVIVENVTANNNNASLMGGGIYVVANGTQFKNITADNNQAERGGGAFIEGNNVVVDIGDFSNNKAIFNESKENSSGLGGALDIAGNGCIVKNVNSTGNTAYRGGSTFIRGNNVTVSNCNLDNNNATVRGGALNIGGGDNCKVINVSVSNNKAGEDGGAIYVIGNYSLFDNVNSTNNTAERGGSSFIAGDNVNVTNCNLDNNNATVRGGGLDVAGSGCVFENVSISNCNSYGDGEYDGGGAVYVVGDDNRFTNVTTVNNTAIHYGGSSYIGGSNNLIENCTVSNNSAYNGGGIFIMGDDSKFTGNNITYNNAIATDEDHEMNINGGGVFILGEGSNFTNNNISSNHAKDNGGGVTVFFGPDTYFEDIYAFNNTAENGGFSNLQFCDGLTIKNSTFYSNHATGDISLNRGEGGAFHIFQSDNIDIQGNFSYNTATNGSAIYVQESTMYVHDTTFFDNQAHSYYLLVTPEENTTYNKNENVTVRISLIGGDNVANAIHNREAASDITLRNLTYPFYNDGVLENRTFSPNEDVSPVIGYENSDNGNLIYLDDLEDNQVIYYEIFNKDTNQSVINLTNNRTDISGSVTLTLSGLEVGNYTVRAHYLETTYYTEIANETVFRVVDEGPKLNITKIANDVFVYVGNQTSFTILVNNTGNHNLSDVVVTDLDVSTGLVYDHYTNGSRLWDYDDRGHWTLVGDLNVNGTANFTVYFNVTTNGTLVNNVSVVSNETNQTNATNSTFAYLPNMTVDKIANDEFVYVGNQTSFTIVVENTGDCNISYVVVTDTDFSSGLVYDHFTNGSGLWDYDGRGHWTLVGDLNVGQTADFTVYFNVTTNGTLVNNVTAKSNLTNETNNTNETKAYKPNLTVVKITDDPIVYVGNQTSFTIMVYNTGDCDLNNVTVKEFWYSEGLVFVDWVPNGERSWTYDNDTKTWTLSGALNTTRNFASFRVFFNVTQNGTLFNNITADSDLTNETNATNNTTAYAPNMTVQKIADDEIVYIGNQTSFTIVVTNTGDCALGNVTVRDDDYSAGLVYTGNFVPVEGDWTYDEATKVWTLVGPLAVNGSASFRVYFNVTLNGTLVNNVTAKSNLTNETNGTNNTTVYAPNMTVQKIADDKIVYVGNQTSFTIVVTNTGDCELNNVTVTDKEYSEGLIFAGIYGSSDSSWEFDNATMTWTLNGPLAVGASASLIVYFNVTLNGTLENNVTAGSNLTNNTTSTNNTTAFAPNMTVQKITIEELVYIGDLVSFRILVNNTGDCDLNNVIVTDRDYSHGLTYVTYENSTGALKWNLTSDREWTLDGILPKGGSAEFIVYFNVTEAGTLTNNVTAKSNLTNETNGTNHTHSYGPSMIIIKVADDNVSYVGNTTSFTIIVVNDGDIELGNVTVRDDDYSAGLVFNGSYDSVKGDWSYDEATKVWTLNGSLAVGGNASFRVYFNVTLPGNLNNTATGKSNLTNETNSTNNTTAFAPNMTVQKVTIDEVVYVGELVRFTIVVENTGDCELDNVYVVDTDYDHSALSYRKYENGSRDWNYDGSGKWTLDGTLAVDEKANFTVWFEVLTNGTIPNNVVAGSNLTNETNGTNNTTGKPICDLVITKIVNTTNCYVDDLVEWNITVVNRGPSTALDVIVKDVLPEGLQLVDVIGGNYDNDTHEWVIGSLEEGKPVSILLVTKVFIDGTIQNNASVNTTVEESNYTNNNASNTTNAKYLSDLVITKVVNCTNCYVSDLVEWKITVVNLGPHSASNVIVKEILPKGMEIIDYNVSVGNFNEVNREWSIGTLEKGTPVSLVLVTKVLIDGTFVNIATVNTTTLESNYTNNRANNTTRADPICDLVISKLVNATKVVKGDYVKWTIKVTNKGPSSALNVKVKDVLPNGLKLINSKASKGKYQKGVWTIGKLAKGSTVTLTLITKTMKAGGITNIATVSTSTHESNYKNNKANNTTVVIEIPPKAICDLVLYKSSDKAKYNVNDTMQWIIKVVNKGPDGAVGAYVKDVLPSSTKFVSYTSSKGSYNETNGVWTIGDIANGEQVTLIITCKVLSAGTITNNAFVNNTVKDVNMSNNYDNATIKVAENKTTHNPTEPNKPDLSLKTGNPLVVALIALIAMFGGLGLRRRKE